MNSWLKEVARDLLALGSIPFYFLVVIRSIIGKYELFVYQMLISAIAILILCFVIKDSNMHVARSLVILVFTGVFYKDSLFIVFASLIWLLILASAYVLRKKFSPIIRGIIIGFLSVLAGYYGSLHVL
ncbi:hypothetical protein HYS31_06660 [Candidatus Woesearchaeota archaeon]|nr:hypothetical protein [Candidatus Woesearchaeota archaeon]